MDIIDTYILPHWMGVGAYVAFIFIGQFMKVQVWTKKAAAKNKVMHWFRRTLAMHAPVAGLMLGAIPGVPASPGVEYPVATMIYYFVIGVLSSFTFHAGSDFAKKKWGVDIKGAIDDAVNPSMVPDDTEKTPKP